MVFRRVVKVLGEVRADKYTKIRIEIGLNIEK